MPKKDYDKIHRANVGIYARKIEAVYDSAVKEAASIGSVVSNFDPSKPFSFSDYPITHDRVKKLSKELQGNLEAVVLNGIDHEWTLSNNKNNELCNRVFGDNVGKLTDEQYRRYYSNNGKAADAFKARKVAGLNLSDRVWKYSDQFKTEIELGIDLDLRDGTPAVEMARNLKQYLQYPDKLFRRVRNEHGQLHLSKSAKAFNPGQGVYRSSVKNAQRLARTETNMAYHAADHERWGQFDFVVGVEVRRSNNTSCHCPLCDSLADKYPKDFKFTGWHPQCRCHAVPVLKTIEELKGDTERIISGEPTNTQSVNTINQMPDSFTNWIEENKGRFGANNTPYFIRDNFKNGKIAEGLRFASGIDKQVVNNVAIDVNRSTFIEAKTITQAQDYASTFAEKHGLDRVFKGGVDYTGISLENANEVNRALSEVFDTMDISKISGIKTISPTSAQGKKIFKSGSDAIAAYSPVEKGIYLNKDILKSSKSFSDYQQKANDAWGKVMNNIDKLSASQREIALKYKEAGRSLVDDSLKGCITHELGHHVQWSMLKADLNNELGHRMSLFSGKISGYATASKSEYLAESFGAYMRKEYKLLDPKYVEFLDLKAIHPNTTTSVKQIAARRHAARSPQQINDIQGRWDERKIDTYRPLEVLNKKQLSEEFRCLQTSHKWFECNTDNIEFYTLQSKGANGATYMAGDIHLTPARMKLNISGVNKLKSGEPISFKEADALSTTWHEITHNRNKIGNLSLSVEQTKFMEMANEFVSRNTLDEFYSAYKTKNPYPELTLNRESTSYNQMVKAYSRLAEKTSEDLSKVVSSVKKGLFDRPYTEQFDALVDGITKNSTLKKLSGAQLDRTEIEHLVRMCRIHNDDMIEKTLNEIITGRAR